MITNKLLSNLILFTAPIIFLLIFSCEDQLKVCPPPPVLSKNVTMQATVGKTFNEVINYTGIESHNSDIDSYQYKYYVQGELPKGIRSTVSNHALNFVGIPEEKGLFIVNVTLRVNYDVVDHEDPSTDYETDERDPGHHYVYDVCEETVTKDYFINVN